MLIIHIWKRKTGKKDSFNKKYIHIRCASKTWDIFSLTKKVRENCKHTDIDDNIYDFKQTKVECSLTSVTTVTLTFDLSQTADLHHQAFHQSLTAV